MKIVAKTSHGLEGILEQELQAIGAENIQESTRAVEFEGDKKVLYRANYELRTAVRVLVPLYDFSASNEERLYKKVRDFDWSEIMSVNRTFAIDSVVNSHFFKHSKYVALKAKDAIVDQFRDATGDRPNVELKKPDFRFTLHIRQDNCTFLLDTSGDSLHKRGYRMESVEAPINEVLAAGMILLSGWDKKSLLIDPMCGSGTIPIEAAMLAANIPPQVLKEDFGFMRLQNFDADIWHEVVEEAGNRINRSGVEIFASDIDPRARHLSRKNATLAGVEDLITFERKDFLDLSAPAETGTMILNPPYDERLASNDIAGFYADIGSRLKNHFQGWSAWLISSNKDALKHIGLKPSKKHTLYNGRLECKYQKFEIFAGKRIEYLKKKEGDL